VRVLIVSNLYPPYWIGGYEQIAEWVATGLADRGHDVTVLTGRAQFSGRSEVIPELDLDLPALLHDHASAGIAFGDSLATRVGRHVFSRANLDACHRAIARVKPDLVSLWNAAFVTFSPLVAARRAGVPAVVHFSDVAANPFRNPRRPSFSEWLVPAARAGVDLLLRWSRPRRFIVPSTFLRDKLVARESLPAERLDVLSWPVEPHADRLAPPAPRAEARRLLYVGALVPEKGPQVLIEAFRRAHAECSGLTLTIIGEGPQAGVRALRQAAADLPVRFLGRQERTAVIEAYRTHEVLVFPSVWDEPFAVVPLEAMAMGLCVIATRAGATPEAVVHDKTGVLVDAGDAAMLASAVRQLHSDPARARALAAAGQKWAREEQGFDGFMRRLETAYSAAASA
jgi:glycosyltransferase involved in cell wall biosynthesis